MDVTRDGSRMNALSLDRCLENVLSECPSEAICHDLRAVTWHVALRLLQRQSEGAV